MANVFSLSAGIFSIVLLASCAKNADVATIAEQSSKLKGDKEFKKCNITFIVSNDLNYPSRTYSFEYNAKGDPVKITPSHIGTGSPLHTFRYDKKGRLTDYIGLYEGGFGFEFWHRYVYNSKDQIVRDTMFIWGVYGQDPTSDHTPSRRITSLEYDAQNRVKRETAVYQFQPFPPSTHETSYDNDGNMVSPGAVYDNQVNMRRTNRIWMFIDRDYSVNNSLPVDVYNSYGLPTVVSLAYFSGMLGYIVPRFVEYDCKGNQEN